MGLIPLCHVTSSMFRLHLPKFVRYLDPVNRHWAINLTLGEAINEAISPQIPENTSPIAILISNSIIIKSKFYHYHFNPIKAFWLSKIIKPLFRWQISLNNILLKMVSWFIFSGIICVLMAPLTGFGSPVFSSWSQTVSEIMKITKTEIQLCYYSHQWLGQDVQKVRWAWR